MGVTDANISEVGRYDCPHFAPPVSQRVSGSSLSTARFCKHTLNGDLIVVTVQQLATEELKRDKAKVHSRVTRDNESSSLHQKVEIMQEKWK